MDITNLKDLREFLSICSKAGVTEITWNGVSAKLGPPPLSAKQMKDLGTKEPTDEELAFAHVDGLRL